VAQLDRNERGTRHPLDPDQRPRVGALVQPLAARSRHDRRAAALLRPLPRAIGRPCRALPRARSAARHHHRQSQVRRARPAPPPAILMFAGPAPPAAPVGLAFLRSAVGGRTVMAAASTHAGEETMLIEAHRRLRASFPRLLTVVAPRHPERGPDILAIAHA